MAVDPASTWRCNRGILKTYGVGDVGVHFQPPNRVSGRSKQLYRFSDTDSASGWVYLITSLEIEGRRAAFVSAKALKKNKFKEAAAAWYDYLAGIDDIVLQYSSSYLPSDIRRHALRVQDEVARYLDQADD